MSILKNKKLLFVLTFIFVFICFFYIQFPNDRLKRRLEFEIEKNTQFDAQIDKIKILPLLKIQINGLKLSRNDQQILISKAVIKPSILSLLSKDIIVKYDINVFKGSAQGDIIITKDSGQLQSMIVKVESLDVDEFTQIYSHSAKENIEIKGLLSGNMNLSSNNTGDFDFYIEDLDILKIKIKTFDLPQFTDLRSNLKGQIYRDRTIINELKFDNEDITLKLKGSTPPLWRLSKGSIDLLYRVDVRSKKYALLKSFLNKDNKGNVAGKIVGSLQKPQLKNVNDSNAQPKRQQGPRFRKTFSPKKQQAI
ncbi:MAG TPA: type II secretion system protein GspN [Thermodesulfobacteriota bacterium]|nr:type II secretion system protein GspN [Thermodesulfobacteriota bacterium]